MFKKRREDREDKIYGEGWNCGYEKGARSALLEARKVFTLLINKEIAKIQTEFSSVAYMDRVEHEQFVAGLNKAIEIINRKK